MHHVSFFTEATLIEIGVYRDRWGDPPKLVAPTLPVAVKFCHVSGWFKCFQRPFNNHEKVLQGWRGCKIACHALSSLSFLSASDQYDDLHLFRTNAMDEMNETTQKRKGAPNDDFFLHTLCSVVFELEPSSN